MLMQTFLNQKLQVQESKKTFSNSKEIPKRFQECIVSDEDSLFSSSSKISYDINSSSTRIVDPLPTPKSIKDAISSSSSVGNGEPSS